MTDTKAIVMKLARIASDLDDLVKRLVDAEHVAAIARHNADERFAVRFLATEGAMDIRRYTARVEASAELLEAATAEAEVRGLRAQIRALETRIDVGRSMNAALRVEAGLA